MTSTNRYQRFASDEEWEEVRQQRLQISKLKKEIADKQIELAIAEAFIIKFFMKRND